MTLLPRPLPLCFKQYSSCFEFPKSEEPPSHILIFPSELPVLRSPAACPELADVQQSILEWHQQPHWGGGLSLSFFRSKRNHLIFSPDPSSAWIMIKIVVRDVSVWLPFKRRGDAAVTSQNIKSRSGTTEVPPDHSKALPSLSLWRIKLRKDFDLLLYALLFFTDSGVFCSSNCWVLLLGKQGTWLTYFCIVSH